MVACDAPGIKPDYVDAYVAVVDIVGFSRTVLESEETRDATGPLAKLAYLHDLLPVRPSAVFPTHYFRCISDTAVHIVGPTSGERRTQALDYLWRWVVRVQLSLLERGLVVRGAISYGDVCVSDKQDIVFGPALLRALELESHKAKFPRVILDPALVLPADWKHRRILCLGDGYWFVNYLWTGDLVVPVRRFGTTDKSVSVYQKHRQTVLDSLARIREPDDLAKCNWLVLYHNVAVEWFARTVRRAPDKSIHADVLACRISEEDVVRESQKANIPKR